MYTQLLGVWYEFEICTRDNPCQMITLGDVIIWVTIVGTRPLYGGEGLSFRSFRKKGGSDFSHKKGGVGKIGRGGGVLKKGGITYFHIN